MHRAEYYQEEIEVEAGHVIRLVYAWWKEHKVLIYKETDEGEFYIKNCDYCYMGGWLIEIPGEYVKGSYGGPGYYVKEYDWYKIKKECSFIDINTQRRKINMQRIKDLAVYLYPDFKYTLNKYNPRSAKGVLDTLTVWKKHPDVELLLAKGYETLAFSKAFCNLSAKRKKDYVRYLMNNNVPKKIRYSDLRVMVNQNITYREYKNYLNFLDEANADLSYGITYRVYKYLKKQLIEGDTPYDIVRYYYDFRTMVPQAGHDPDDEYWKYPPDLVKAHNKLVKEVKYSETQKMKRIMTRIKKIADKFSDIPNNINGYSIFISSNYMEWEKQAKELHQCIVASGYYKGMADGRYTIVFIQKNGVPIATAQVYPSGNIGQFYGNERDRSNCLPTPEVKKAFDKWMKKVPKERFRKKKEKQRHAA